MSIYWESCSVCFRHHPVKQCGLINDLMVCVYCCLTCIKREACPRRAWVFESEEKTVRKDLREEAERFLEEIEFLSGKSRGRINK